MERCTKLLYEVICDSLQLTKKFGKRHTNVLPAIDDLKKYSTQNWVQYFKLSSFDTPHS